jgi:hypothetical protein
MEALWVHALSLATTAQAHTTRLPRGWRAGRAISPCTNSGHTPVDVLHMIENKPDKTTLFELTLFLEGVKQSCSLTAS